MLQRPNNGPASCPICASSETAPFVRRARVPVHQHLTFDSANAARAARHGTLDLRACHRCGFVFNAAFDEALLEYGSGYENSQDLSPGFDAYLNELVDHLVRRCGIRAGHVIEIGCGKGAFLRKLLNHPDSTCAATGFDPSYMGPAHQLDGRLHFVAAPYRADSGVQADFVILRHLIEHVVDPMALLRDVRAALNGSPRARVIVETPCVEWILRRQVPWDFYYEHCSLFTAGSLGLALTLAGLSVTAIRHVFGGQYLLAEAGNGALQWDLGEVTTPALSSAYADAEPRHVERWLRLVDTTAGDSEIVVWGAGAKGATFCLLADSDASRVQGVVDINPAKQGRYLCGTGHPILAPRQAVSSRLSMALVLNPNYLGEVSAMLADLGSHARVVDLMAQERNDAIDD